MPVAIITAKANALPYRFTLSDSMNLMPGRNLSEMESVVVVAHHLLRPGHGAKRRSRRRYAAAAPGGQPVKLVIERVTPRFTRCFKPESHCPPAGRGP